MENKDKPAFATDPRIAVASGDARSGLSKREYFAAMAMQRLLASGADVEEKEKIAKHSVELADELLKQLESNP